MKAPRPIRAVVFDMDGLLCDSERVFRDVMIEAAVQFGRALPTDVFLMMVGASEQRARDIMRGHFGADFPLESYESAVRLEARARFARGVDLKPGVSALLDHLDQAGLPRAICTSSSKGAVRSHLGPSGVLDRFHAVIARGDYENGKPHRDPYLAAARALSVAPGSCLALEDSHNGVTSAHAAGMMTVMVPDLLPATAEIRARCIAICDSLDEVRAHLAAAP